MLVNRCKVSGMVFAIELVLMEVVVITMGKH